VKKSLAALSVVIAVAGCGGSSSSGSKTSQSTQSSTATSAAQSNSSPVAVNKSVVQPAPGGSKVKITLISYDPKVAEKTGDALAPKVLGVTLRLQNLGPKAVNAHAPTYYSVLHLANTTGASTVPGASGPCGGSFYRSPIRLAPHGSSQGCIPYQYGSSPPVSFGFGFGLKTANWSVRAK
jgi:hypothetical protein